MSIVTAELPLFPLNTVLFPGGPLPLRIFEQRYLDMISRVLKANSGFGVCLLTGGREAGGSQAAFHAIGTEAIICDWNQGTDGLLHVLCHGKRQFRVRHNWVQDDGLHIGKVEWLPEPAALPLPEPFTPLARWLQTVWPQLPDYYADLTRHDDEAGWVAWRLTEILPLNNAQKQYLLETVEPLKRLQVLQPLIHSLRQE